MPLVIRRRTAVALAAMAVALPLYLFPTAVGLNGDLGRYGTDGMRLLCGTGDRVWDNYQFEPLFVTIMLVFSSIWGTVTGASAHCAEFGLGIFWLPISLSVVLILLQMYAVRHLGGSAICYHLVFTLDTVLLMLPFNLFRQFLAVVLVVTMTVLILQERIKPPLFAAGLVLAALIHWSAWLLVLVGLVTMGAQALPALLRSSTASARRRWTVRLAVAIALAAGVYLLVFFVLPRFQMATSRGFPLSLESSVRGLVSPVSLSVLAFALAIGQGQNPGFLRTFMIGSAALYVLAAVSGNVAAMERLRSLVLPVVYLAFLHLLRMRAIAPRWQLFNVLFLVFIILNFSWHAAISRPFAGRPSFTKLIGY